MRRKKSMKKLDKYQKLVLSIGVFAVLVGILFRIYGYHPFYYVDCYSTTLLSFNYFDYGFGSRMLIGTMYALLCKILPCAYGYKGAFWFMMFFALVMAITLIVFAVYLIGKLPKEKTAVKQGVASFTSLALVWLIISNMIGQNFGKPDALIIAVNVLQVYLLLENKKEWLVPLLSLVGVCCHEGYLCMTACVSIGLLLYKAVRCTKKEKLYYWGLFVANLVLICGPAVYFVFFKPQLTHLWDTALAVSKGLSLNKGVHIELIAQRLNAPIPESIDMTSVITDAEFKLAELKETPVFIILALPALIRFVTLIKALFKRKDGINRHTGLYIGLFAVGVILVAVEFYLFCDFGRYVGWLIFYFWIILTYIAIKEKNGEEAFALAYQHSEKGVVIRALALLPLLPLNSSYYSFISALIAGLLF